MPRRAAHRRSLDVRPDDCAEHEMASIQRQSGEQDRHRPGATADQPDRRELERAGEHQQRRRDHQGDVHLSARDGTEHDAEDADCRRQRRRREQKTTATRLRKGVLETSLLICRKVSR